MWQRSLPWCYTPCHRAARPVPVVEIVVAATVTVIVAVGHPTESERGSKKSD